MRCISPSSRRYTPMPLMQQQVDVDASDPSIPRFLLHEPIAVIASPGRDRLMMGHVAALVTHSRCRACISM